MKYSVLGLMVMLLVASPLQAKKVYKHTDSTGKTVYSDKPLEGGEEINLPPVQTYTSKPLADRLDSMESQKDEVVPEYKVVIVNPPNDFVVHKDVESVDIQVFIEPELNETHLVQLYINEEPYAQPQKSLLFTLNDLNRGTYTIKAVIFDSKKNAKTLNESPPIEIHVQRAHLSQANPFKTLTPPQESN